MTEEETRRLIIETVHATLSGLGCDMTSPQELQADFRYLRKGRIRSEQVGNKILMTLVGLLVPASLYILWENAKRTLKGE